MPIENIRKHVFPLLRSIAARVTESHILFPLFALVMMAVVWGTTLNLIRVEHNSAENSALALTRELLETYEAQVLRVLREVDKDFKIIQYAYDQGGETGALSALESRNLLPPAFLFTVTTVDAEGDVTASTDPSGNFHVDQDYIQRHRDQDMLYIAPPRQNALLEWKLQFTRRLNGPGGAFAGVIIIEADAAFFVSSYDTAKMGHQGLLGLVGTDGIYRVRRVGESISAGETVAYGTLVERTDPLQTVAFVASSPLDGVERYISSRELYDFPLAVISGLSRQEQLAAVDSRAWDYLWRALWISVLMLFVISLLWRMSHKLAQSRKREVEAQITHARQVEYLAYHDSLTGLPNRSLFSNLLRQSISQAQRNRRKLAVLFLDLDHFKHINDTLGHDAGDQLLQDVAARLKGCLRESDTVARLGGDEFVVLLPEIADEMDTINVARKINAAVARPYNLKGQDFRVTASIGISSYPEDGLDEQTLTKNADIAMYKVKEEGKNNFQLYSEKLHSESLERLTLESALRNALERKEFHLYYQAKRDMAGGRITGMEALLRWQHPDLGTVAPLRFIPVAEEIGLIIPIGKWVLETACEQNVRWQRQGLPRMNIAVNLSSQQFFDENLARDITAVLNKTGMDAKLLELEVSENVLMQNVERALTVLNSLKDLGVHIAIDNFGVGYSSLAMLKQFPLDAIKIDRTFIRDISDPGEDKILAKAIVAMGRTLGLTVVAQGVETEEQVKFLRDNACDELQGFYFNKPLPAEEFATLLRSQRDSVPDGSP